MTTEERKQARADFVKQYIESASSKGVKVTHSVNILSNKVLFISERQIYDDLKKGRQYNNQDNKY